MDDLDAESSGFSKHARHRASGMESEPATPPSAKSASKGGFAGLRSKSSMQDRLMEKMLQQVIPVEDMDDNDGPLSTDVSASSFAQKPNFNLSTMSANFRRFNARIGVVFKFQAQLIKVLSWQRTSHTLSLLAVYTLVCLDPNLLCVLPVAVLLLGVFVPGFLARHPAPPKGTLSSEQSVGYSPRGPPLAPAATVRPVKELSRDFFRNMRDLQNVMGDFSDAHDQVVALVVPITNFSNEALSSAVFQFLFFGGILLTVSAQLLPWRVVMLAGGWLAICAGHPGVARFLASSHREHIRPKGRQARSWFDAWVAHDVILDSAPETREVEVFELQRMSDADSSDAGGEWEPWVFSPSPYDPLSQQRLAGDRPQGTRFFEDVMAPEGWEWSEKKWALDLWSREWVEERIITGVEVETEGERWVYDMYDEREQRTGVVDYPDSHKNKSSSLHPATVPLTSWEEGEDASARRGEWRRRRWVRLVKRKAVAPSAGSKGTKY